MNPCKASAQRLEMASGRINAMSGGGGVSSADLEEAIFDRDSERTAFHAAVEEATGMTIAQLAFALQL